MFGNLCSDVDLFFGVDVRTFHPSSENPCSAFDSHQPGVRTFHPFWGISLQLISFELDARVFHPFWGNHISDVLILFVKLGVRTFHQFW